jgi:hypothetical protein
VSDDWQARADALWASFDEHEPAAFLARMSELVDERPPQDPLGAFEMAGAYDSTGQPHEAAPLYRRALAAGLSGLPRRRATIQLASTLRNLGETGESVALLRAERAAGSNELDDAVAAFLALALADAGREREAVGVVLAALAPHLPRYQRSVAAYAEDLR